MKKKTRVTRNVPMASNESRIILNCNHTHSIYKGRLCIYECTHRCPSERSVVTVFLPGAVQTDYEILEKGMSFVEHREPDDVDPLVCYVAQLK